MGAAVDRPMRFLADTTRLSRQIMLRIDAVTFSGADTLRAYSLSFLALSNESVILWSFLFDE